MSVPAQQMLQKVKVPATKALAAELLARVQEVPFLEEKGYYVFSELDVTRQTRFETFPVVAIAYAGLTVIDRSPDSNPNCGRRATDTDAIFDLLIGEEYMSIDDENTLPTAVDLLDAVRGHLLGYKGVHTRVWRLAGETPIAGESEGIVWYGQQWATRVTQVGTFVNSQ